ncbi:MAG: tetratricopeptide repeat protein [Candidatus Melainabacteria bacterium]|nr:tetratricopeptide repeat protein [Candidatus Melainabacteria bacterium]
MSNTARYFLPERLFNALSLAFVLSLCLHLPSIAANEAKNPYEMGIEFYKNGDYPKASHYLEHVAKLKPTFWPVHYWLGNLYMKTGDLEKAKTAYMNCLNNKPDVPTCVNCSKAMEYLHVAIAERQKNQPDQRDPNISPEVQAKIDQVVADSKRETEAHEARLKEATEKRDKILAEGQREAAAIKARYEAQYRWIDENTNQWVINRETGVIRTGLDVDTHADLQAQCDEEVKRVLDLSEARARGVHIPAPPTIGTSLHASNVHSSSNQYVRHYKHPAARKHPNKLATGTATTSK